MFWTNLSFIRKIARISWILIILLGLSILIRTIISPNPVQVQAQAADSFYFSPESVTLNPTGTTTLRANAGSSVVNFVGVKVQIDITKVKLTAVPIYPLVESGAMYLAVPASSLANINCAVVADDPTTANCKNGVITFALAVYPDAGNVPQTGIFDIAQLSLTSDSYSSTTSEITYVSPGNEIVDNATGQDLSLTITNPAATLTVYPIPTPSPAAVPGDANGDRKVDETDYGIWFSHFLQSVTAGVSLGDFDGNGKVDGVDYTIWLKYYGT